MRDLVQRIVSGYKGIKLEGQDEGFIVFRGQEPGSRQTVSIKILPRLLGRDPQIAQKFEGLARAVRQLQHPNIAAIRQIGEEAGLPYIVTQALEKAQPLVVRLNQPWAVDVAADVVMQLGQALDYAYRQGIVHGNLTPDNIVITDDGQVQITDLGLEELAELVGGRVLEVTSPFLAPERRAGQPADSTADVYSLAAILYAMLTNRPPQTEGDRVLPPSRFNADIPPALDRVLVKALAPDPADRYPDAPSFTAALGAVTLTAPGEGAPALPSGQRCPHCGAEGQTGRFCRKCGARLPKQKASTEGVSHLDEPIQMTRISVGDAIQVGSGIRVQATTIARPMMIATGEALEGFPEPLEMPQVDLTALWADIHSLGNFAMPEPLPMPQIEWAEEALPMPEPLVFDEQDTTLQ